MRFPLCLVLFIGTFALAHAADREALKAELVKAETDFCARAARDGLPVAFAASIAPDGVLLAAGYEKRGEAVVRQEYAAARPGVTLSWKPEIVDVAASGDLGYTTGHFELRIPGENGAEPTLRTGRYMTVWKRQPDGTWKFVLDGGVPDRPKK